MMQVEGGGGGGGESNQLSRQVLESYLVLRIEFLSA